MLPSADLVAVNLETAITIGGTPQPKTYHFRASGAAFTALWRLLTSASRDIG